MARQKTEIIGGVADWFYAPIETTAPDDSDDLSDAWPAGWVGNFYTQEGVSLEESKNMQEWRVEEESNDVNTFLDSRTMQVTLNIAQDSIDAKKLAFGGGTITTTAAGAGQPAKKTLVLSNDLDELMLGIQGKNPEGFYERWIFPSVKSVGNFGRSFRRAQYRITPVTFKILGAVEDIEHYTITGPATS